VTGCRILSIADACIYDIDAVADGTLLVDTRAALGGQRWRTVLMVFGTKATKSNTGTGSSTSFTGAVSRPVAAGKRYEVVVFYERPLPSTFPTSVEVRFTGPVTVSPRQVYSPLAARYVGIYRVPSIMFDESFSFEPSADGTHVARILGAVNCGDRYPFDVHLSPGVLPISGDGRFSATGISVPGAALDVDGVIFDADQADDSSEQALGGLTIIRGSRACPYQWWATAEPDTDRDGWNNRAEQRLGSTITDRLSVPENAEVPGTPFYGPAHCADGADNDLDGATDGSDSDCAGAAQQHHAPSSTAPPLGLGGVAPVGPFGRDWISLDRARHSSQRSFLRAGQPPEAIR
jgi:hypothetical protein